MTPRILLSLLLVCLGALPARAQDPTGAIEGTVVDRTGLAVPGASVVATSTATGLTKETVSGSDGSFRVPLLPVGTYRVTIEAPQFARVVFEPVEVSVGQIVRVNAE